MGVLSRTLVASLFIPACLSVCLSLCLCLSLACPARVRVRACVPACVHAWHSPQSPRLARKESVQWGDHPSGHTLKPPASDEQ